jgi:hypothetical protein
MRLADATTPALLGVQNRLRESSAKIAALERHLAAERKRRDLLMLKLSTAGASTRDIGGVAGVSSPGVTLALRRGRAALSPEGQK